MSFSTLGLAQPLGRALEAKGYDTPTPFQQQAIPTLLEGRDLLGIAQTGTGKTAAFVLPSLQRLDEAGQRPLPYHCRMLVLTPTREQAPQHAANAPRSANVSPPSDPTLFRRSDTRTDRQRPCSTDGIGGAA